MTDLTVILIGLISVFGVLFVFGVCAILGPICDEERDESDREQKEYLDNWAKQKNGTRKNN